MAEFSSFARPPEFLTNVFGHTRTVPGDQTRPTVTLTFAQSLDGKIAGKGGKQLILSGKESMIMTHWTRTMHDAILVGIGTALNDDPQLNTRHLPPRSINEERYHIPRPIILDSYLRLSPDCKLLKNFRNGTGRRPWIICSSSSQNGTESSNRTALESAGAKVIGVNGSEGKISIPDLLRELHNLNIHSLMVEGGASIIGSFLTEASLSLRSMPSKIIVDTVIITIAPTFIGDDGIGYDTGLAGDKMPVLRHIRSECMGIDTVVALRLCSR